MYHYFQDLAWRDVRVSQKGGPSGVLGKYEDHGEFMGILIRDSIGITHIREAKDVWCYSGIGPSELLGG